MFMKKILIFLVFLLFSFLCAKTESYYSSDKVFDAYLIENFDRVNYINKNFWVKKK